MSSISGKSNEQSIDRMSSSSSGSVSKPPDRKSVISNLCDRISSIHSTGSFATFGVIEPFVNPGLSVDGVGLLRLPLSKEDAYALTGVSQRAPFGRGSETIIDESVRKTWEINADRVKFLNDGWQRCLDRISDQVAQDLGVGDEVTNIRAELYKMLLYEEGAKFKEHKDTEKVPGMFATLVICFPSIHEGGDVCLRHEGKSARYATSDHSAFDATFIAWYNDVNHEIEPVKAGYRWVLTYNLIHESKTVTRTASCLDLRVNQTASELANWQKLGDAPPYLAYVLSHQYTKEGLALSRLKGDDYHRARHVAQSCDASGEYFTLLANIEMCRTDENDEEAGTPTSELTLTRIVNLQGHEYESSSYPPVMMYDDSFLHPFSYEDREPDLQRGGNYTGNQHAEIEQYFKDSVMLIVPSKSLLRLFLRNNYSPEKLERLMQKLRHSMQTTDEDETRQILLAACRLILSTSYGGKEQNDLYLGPAAVTAAFLGNSSLFTEVIGRLNRSFRWLDYHALGALIDLDGFAIPESDIIRSLTENAQLYQSHRNLKAFHCGFINENPKCSQKLERGRLSRWLYSVTLSCLHQFESVFPEDAKALIELIVSRNKEPFGQFVLYQGARVFAERFGGDEVFINTLLVELLMRLQHPNPSEIYLESLLQRIMGPAIDKFNLSRYAASYKPRSSGAYESDLSGPVQGLYQRVCAYEKGTPSQFLRKLMNEASTLTPRELDEFLIPFLGQSLLNLDLSFIEAQHCVESLASTYTMHYVKLEPTKPKDWARPEEIPPEPCNLESCDDCLRMNGFLKDSVLQHHTLSGKDNRHVWNRYYRLKYFETVSWTGTRYKPLLITKTTKYWEMQHQEWSRRASRAQEALGTLPQAELKQSLRDRYDDFMELRAVKIKPDEDTGEKEQNDASIETASSPKHKVNDIN